MGFIVDEQKAKEAEQAFTSSTFSRSENPKKTRSADQQPDLSKCESVTDDTYTEKADQGDHAFKSRTRNLQRDRSLDPSTDDEVRKAKSSDVEWKDDPLPEWTPTDETDCTTPDRTEVDEYGAQAPGGSSESKEKKRPSDAAEKPAKTRKGTEQFTGEIINLAQMRREDIPSRTHRFFQSIFQGVPYSHRNRAVKFEVLLESGKVVPVRIYIQDSQGIENNRSITVTGRMNRDHIFIAQSFQVHDSNVIGRAGISANSLRFIVFLVLAMIACEIYWFGGRINSNDRLGPLVIIAVFLLCVFTRTRNSINPRRRR